MARLNINVNEVIQTDPTLPRRDKWPSQLHTDSFEAGFLGAVLAARGSGGWSDLVDWYLDMRPELNAGTPPGVLPRPVRAFATDSSYSLSDGGIRILFGDTNSAPVLRHLAFSASGPVWQIIQQGAETDPQFIGAVERAAPYLVGANAFICNFLAPNARVAPQSSNALATTCDAILDRLNPAVVGIPVRVPAHSIRALTFDSPRVTGLLVRVLSCPDRSWATDLLRGSAIEAAQVIAPQSQRLRRALEPVALRGSKDQKDAAQRILDRSSGWAPTFEQVGSGLARLRTENSPNTTYATMAYLDCSLEQDSPDPLDQLRLDEFHAASATGFQGAKLAYDRDLELVKLNEAAHGLPHSTTARAFYVYTSPWDVRLSLQGSDCSEAVVLSRAGYAELKHPTRMHLTWQLSPVDARRSPSRPSGHGSLPPLASLTLRGPLDDSSGRQVAAVIATSKLEALDVSAVDDAQPTDYFPRSEGSLVSVAQTAATNPLQSLIFDGNALGAIVDEEVTNPTTNTASRVRVTDTADGDRAAYRVLGALLHLVKPERLEHLSFNRCGLPHTARDQLTYLFRRCTNISRLGLAGCDYLFTRERDDGSNSFPFECIEAMGQLPLRDLDVSGRTLMGSVDTLGVLMRDGRRIERLNLRGTDFYFWAGSKFTSAPSTTGYRLDVSRTQNTHVFYSQPFFAHLAGQAGYVDASQCDLSDVRVLERLVRPAEGVVRCGLALAYVRPPIPNVVNYLIDAGVAETLTELDLSGHPLLRRDAIALVNHFPNLRRVSLVGCQLGKSARQILVHGISSDAEMIDLSGNMVSPQDIRVLRRRLRPLLSEVGLVGCGLTDAEVRELIPGSGVPLLRTIRYDDGPLNVIAERYWAGQH